MFTILFTVLWMIVLIKGYAPKQRKLHFRYRNLEAIKILQCATVNDVVIMTVKDECEYGFVNNLHIQNEILVKVYMKIIGK